MAIRLYECAAGVEFEETQSVKDPPLDTCPLCGKCTPKRLIGGAPPVLFVEKITDCGGWSSKGYSKSLNQRRCDKKLGRS